MTDITTTAPSAAAVVAASLPANLRERALRIVASDRAAGAALLAKSRELRGARAEAAPGDWYKLLKVVNIHEQQARRHIMIAERAEQDPRFERAVLDGFLLFATAALAARADEQLLSELLELPEPPSRRQVEALLASPAEPEPEQKPDTGVGSVDWAIQRLLQRRWTTDTQIVEASDELNYIVRDSESGERWTLDANGLILAAKILDQEPQISPRELFGGRLGEFCEEPAETPVVAAAAPDAYQQIEAEAERYGLLTDWQINGSVILSWPGEAAADLEPFSPAEALDWLRNEASIEAERRQPGSPIRSIEAAGWRIAVDHNLYHLYGPAGGRGPDTLVVGRDGLVVAARELAQRPGLTVAQLSDLVQFARRADPARPALPDDLSRRHLMWLDTPDGRLLITQRGTGDVLAAGSPDDPQALIAQARHNLATGERPAPPQVGSALPLPPRDEEAETEEGPEPPRPIEAEEAETDDTLQATFAAALRDPAVQLDTPHARVLLPVARELLNGDVRPELELPPQGETWPVAGPTLQAALIHAVRARRAGDLAGLAFSLRPFTHKDARAMLCAAAEAVELARAEQQAHAAEGAVAPPALPELPADLAAAGVRWQPLKYSKLSVLHRGGMVFASAATADEAIAQAQAKLAVEAQQAQIEAQQALVERARALGAEVDVEPGGQRYHVLPPHRSSDEWLSAEQLAERVTFWEMQRSAAQSEEGEGRDEAPPTLPSDLLAQGVRWEVERGSWALFRGKVPLIRGRAGTPLLRFVGPARQVLNLPHPSWRDDSPRIAETIQALLCATEPGAAALAAAQLSWALAGGDSTRWTLDLAEQLNPDMLALLIPLRDAFELENTARRAEEGLRKQGMERWANVVRAAARQIKEVGK